MTSQEKTAVAMEPPDEEAEISIMEILVYLGQHKGFVLKFTGALTLLGIVVSLVLPVKYDSVVKLMPPQQNQSSALSIMSQLGAATGGSIGLAAAGRSLLSNPNDLYIAMAESRPTVDGLIQKFNLMKYFKAKDMTAARKNLAGETTIASGKDGLIEITVEDHDRKMAADLANGYVDGLRNLTDHLATTEAGQRRVYFEGQVQEATDALAQAETNLQQTQERTGAVAPDSQVKATVDAAVDLEQKITATEVQLQALQAYEQPGNIDVQVKQRELNELEAQLARVDQSHNSGGDPLNMGLRSMPSTQIEYQRSYREFLEKQTILEALKKQLEAARLDEAREGAIIQVVESAIPADHKSSPIRSLIVLGFAVGSMLLSCLYLLFQAAVQNNPEFARSVVELKRVLFHG